MDFQNPDHQQKVKEICNRIVLGHREAICIALIELDCGCIHVSGVSFTGAPVSVMESYDRDLESSGEGPVCIRCAGAGGPIMDRITTRKLIWPGNESEMPDEELRGLIGREVFGPDYTEQDG